VVVEDVFTTGKSTREVIDTVTSAGARVLAAGSIVDRGLPPGSFAVPHRSLLNLSVPSWPADSCPLCADGKPLDTPGSRYSAAR
jgi:orotate phosphoribosyltransferase